MDWRSHIEGSRPFFRARAPGLEPGNEVPDEEEYEADVTDDEIVVDFFSPLPGERHVNFMELGILEGKNTPYRIQGLKPIVLYIGAKIPLNSAYDARYLNVAICFSLWTFGYLAILLVLHWYVRWIPGVVAVAYLPQLTPLENVFIMGLGVMTTAIGMYGWKRRLENRVDVEKTIPDILKDATTNAVWLALGYGMIIGTMYFKGYLADPTVLMATTALFGVAVLASFHQGYAAHGATANGTVAILGILMLVLFSAVLGMGGVLRLDGLNIDRVGWKLRLNGVIDRDMVEQAKEKIIAESRQQFDKATVEDLKRMFNLQPGNPFEKIREAPTAERHQAAVDPETFGLI